MKHNAYDNAFGRAPEGFTRRVTETLRDIDTAPRRAGRPRGRIVLVAALVATLLLGVAYGTIQRIGLNDFFADLEWVHVNEEGEGLLLRDKPIASFTVGDVRVNVANAVADSYAAYVMVEFVPPTEDALLIGHTKGITPYLPADISGRRLIGIEFNMIIEGEENAPSNFYPAEFFDGDKNAPLDFLRQADGALVGLNIGRIDPNAKKITIRCEVTTYEMDGISLVREDTIQTGEGTFTLRVNRDTQTRGITEPVTLVQDGLRIDSFTLTRTPLTTHYAFSYMITDADKAKNLDFLVITNELGTEIGDGIGIWSRYWTRGSDKNGLITVTGTLSMDELPETAHVLPMYRVHETSFRPGKTVYPLPLDMVE